MGLLLQWTRRGRESIPASTTHRSRQAHSLGHSTDVGRHGVDVDGVLLRARVAKYKVTCTLQRRSNGADGPPTDVRLHLGLQGRL